MTQLVPPPPPFFTTIDHELTDAASVFKNVNMLPTSGLGFSKGMICFALPRGAVKNNMTHVALRGRGGQLKAVANAPNCCNTFSADRWISYFLKDIVTFGHGWWEF